MNTFDIDAWLIAVEPLIPAPKPAPAAQKIAGNPLVGDFPRANRTNGQAIDDRTHRLQRAIAYIDAMPGAVSGQDGHGQTFDAACAIIKGFDLSIDEARPILHGYSARCSPPWSDREVEHKLGQADAKPDDKARGYLYDAPNPKAEYDGRERGVLGDGRYTLSGDSGIAHPGTPPNATAGGQGGNGHDNGHRPGDHAARPGDAPTFEFSDMGNAHRLLHLHGSRIRFCKPYGDWLIFDGKRWIPDERLEIEAFAQDIPGQVLAEMPPTNNDEAIKAFRKWSLASQSKDRLASAITAARNHVSVIPNELDRDPWLLNVQNGTIHLKTGEFRPHRSGDLITKFAPVMYDPAAQAPRWRQFVSEIMKDDPTLVDYLQRALGYAISGVIVQHVFFCCYGTGANGKTSLFKQLHDIIGDYANEIDSDILLSQSSAQHPTGLTELEGRRLVISEETDDTRRLAEALVKKLTGGSATISARKMHKDFYKFRATHHLFLATNHKPEIRGTDPAIWRRIKLLPFEVSFDPAVVGGRKPDYELDQKLAKEHSGILNWLIEGCRAWQERGLAEPPAILAATRGYREEMDTLGWFLEERCVAQVTKSRERTVLSVLYGEYVAWCGTTNIIPVGIRKFSTQLTDRGHETKKSHSTVFKMDIRFKKEFEKAYDMRHNDGEGGEGDGSDGVAVESGRMPWENKKAF